MTEVTSADSFVLTIYDGNTPVSKLNLSDFKKNRITFGSGTGNDIALAESGVNDFYGYFQMTAEGWRVFSANTDGGIIINGNTMFECLVANGTNIKLGKYTIVINQTDTIRKQSDEKKVPEKKSKLPVSVIVTICICGTILLGIVGWFVFSTIFGSSELEPADSFGGDDESVVVADASSVVSQTQPVDAVVPEMLPTDKSCNQLVLVKADGSYVDLVLYEKVGDFWVEKFQTSGRCGTNGISNNKIDGDSCTPAGEFPLNFCLGISKPETKMSFEWVDANTVWVDDSSSRYYNTIQQGGGDWASSEYIYGAYFNNNTHNYLINIAFNGDGLTPGSATAGRGSVITICGKYGTLDSTQGCIDIGPQDMLTLLSYLDSNQNPRIIIY